MLIIQCCLYHFHHDIGIKLARRARWRVWHSKFQPITIDYNSSTITDIKYIIRGWKNMEGRGVPVVVRCGLGKSEETFIKHSLTPGVYYFFPFLFVLSMKREREAVVCWQGITIEPWTDGNLTYILTYGRRMWGEDGERITLGIVVVVIVIIWS